MKKYLSLFLAIVMVFAIAINVFAEGETNYFKIGETEYATLADALAAAQDGDTIEMLADDEISFTEGGLIIDRSLTIEGNGCTVKGVSDVG